MKSYKPKIGKRLYQNFSMLIVFIILIGVAGLIVINTLKKTSQKIVYEFIELDAIHDLRDAFNGAYIPAYSYIIYKQPSDLAEFKNHVDTTKKYLKDCNLLLSSSHNKELLKHFNLYLLNFEHIVNKSHIIKDNIYEYQPLYNELNKVLINANDELEHLLNETKSEIDEYINTNATASKHSTVTILLLLIVVITVGYIFIMQFIKQITNPLRELVKGTEQITKGNLSVKTTINSNDELEFLGNSFNQMVTNLKETTVSKNFFNDILKSMYDSVIVTNEQGIITLTNRATNNLLNFTTKELHGRSISDIVFESDNSRFSLDDKPQNNLTAVSNLEKIYKTKNNDCIPVLFSYAAIKNNNKVIKGHVFVAHDIRVQKEMNRQIDKIRKSHLIEINEAQEKERLRIAKELHDGLGVILTSMSYYLENNFSKEKCSEQEIETHVHNMRTKINTAIKESKSIAHDLIPILLKDFGLIVAVESMVNDINKNTNTSIDFKAFNLKKRLDEKIEKALYRVIQEATNNIIKHAQATEVDLQIINHNNLLVLIISDNGVGFDINLIQSETSNKGIGLISMKERIEAFEGNISIHSAPNEGTEIIIEIPTNN